MKMLNLKKQNTNVPKIDELSEMISDLKGFLNEDVDFNDGEWCKNLNTILEFQDDDGSFKLFNSSNVPSDARVDFCWVPTYICAAILMKAYLINPDEFTLKEKSALSEGLKMSCVKNLCGHGYDALKGQIEILNMFLNAGLNEFMDLHHDFCPEFTGMIEKIISQYKDKIVQEDFIGPWGESYKDEIKAISQSFSQRLVFVYGTLMKGERNHGYLENSTLIGKGVIEGYDMYDVGWYPSIVEGNGLIVGELYKVPKSDIESIDMLEGEGFLYSKRCEKVTVNGKTFLAFVYVYLKDVSELEKIQSWKEEYLWYVSYGSNMSYDRFMYYIKGGAYGSSVPRDPCEDTTPPVAVKAIKIPFDMYFAEKSRWGGGVSFLDISKEGHSFGVAYLITKKQFEHVATQENGNNPTNGKKGWYKDLICLGKMNGFEMKTVTSDDLHKYNDPTDEYLEVLRMGMRKNWPEMSDKEIEDYLDACIR